MTVADGTVHRAPADLKAAVEADPAALALWQDLTPLGRNEFICWVEDAKQAATRERRIARSIAELLEGGGGHAAGPDASTAPTRHRTRGSRRS